MKTPTRSKLIFACKSRDCPLEDIVPSLLIPYIHSTVRWIRALSSLDSKPLPSIPFSTSQKGAILLQHLSFVQNLQASTVIVSIPITQCRPVTTDELDLGRSMERSLKRARVSPKTGGSHGVHRYINNGPLSKDSSDFPQPGLKSRSFSKPHSLSLFSENIGRSTKAISPGHRKLSDLHPRNLIPTKVKGAAEAVQSPSSTVVASVIQVVVNNPAGDLVTQALVPVASKIISVQGFAPITLGKGPATASAIPSAASISKQASHHQQPSPTDATGQDSYGPRTTAAGTRRPLQSQSPERSASANPSHLSINVPGSKSQVLLSSPPSTPLPSTPASTLSSSPSTDSYFSTSAPTATSATNSALNAAPATQTSNAHNMPAPPKSNSTLTTTCEKLSPR